MSPNAIDLERLAETLQTQRYGRSIRYTELTGSTNDDARSAGGPAGHVVVADAQTAGRGSRGRSWQSPPGTDLYVSIVDRLPLALSELPPLTLAVGLGVAEAVDALLGSAAPRAQVKWPNDVLIQGKKCAGILVEANSGLAGDAGDKVVIGIGLNLNREQFPVELTGNATSLALSGGAPADRTRALQVLLTHVEQRVDAFVREGAAATVRALSSRLALLGAAARCDEQDGVVRGVAESGALLFETARGIQTVVAGRLTAL